MKKSFRLVLRGTKWALFMIFRDILSLKKMKNLLFWKKFLLVFEKSLLFSLILGWWWACFSLFSLKFGLKKRFVCCLWSSFCLREMFLIVFRVVLVSFLLMNLLLAVVFVYFLFDLGFLRCCSCLARCCWCLFWFLFYFYLLVARLEASLFWLRSSRKERALRLFLYSWAFTH